MVNLRSGVDGNEMKFNSPGRRDALSHTTVGNHEVDEVYQTLISSNPLCHFPLPPPHAFFLSWDINLPADSPSANHRYSVAE